MLFCQADRNYVKAEHPEWGVPEIAKELGKRWAEMIPEDKEHYQKKADEAKKKYDEDLAAYKKENGLEEDPNMPKKPLTAYITWSQDNRDKVKAELPELSVTEVVKELGKRWKELSPEDKQQYQQKAEEARKKYDEDMTAYRQAHPEKFREETQMVWFEPTISTNLPEHVSNANQQNNPVFQILLWKPLVQKTEQG